MYSAKEFLRLLEEFAPLSLSKAMIERGAYDNSGLLVKNHDGIKRVLFTLDLSEAALKRARALKCDTVVTHHPAIYIPVKEMCVDGANANVLRAVRLGLNVYSMHLNLDVAEGGIDHCLCKALGGEKYRILDYVDELHGYGREFELNEGVTLGQFAQKIKRVLSTNRVTVYGNRRSVVKTAASFCGSGSSNAVGHCLDGNLKADVVVTSDVPHHSLLSLVEAGKCVIAITHYAAENVGFRSFYEWVAKNSNGIEVIFFEDKRFI